MRGASPTRVRTGRRPGSHDTAGEIIAAARRCFAELGYDATTMRAVAAASGVDAALVYRHFGNKQGLFLAAVGLPADLRALMTATVQARGGELGARIVRTFIETWDAGPLRGASFSGLLRLATTEPDAAAALRRYVDEALAETLSQVLGVRRAGAAAASVGAHLLGLGVARYVLDLEPLASADPAAIATRHGPLVDRLLGSWGELPESKR